MHPFADRRRDGSGAGGCGLDLVEVDRFRAALERHPRLQERLFTEAELAYCLSKGRPYLHMAARFAAKEAVGKLLGRGVVSWHEIEVAGGERPCPMLTGKTAEIARTRNIVGVEISLSHVDTVAGACVMAVVLQGGGEEMSRSSDKENGCSSGHMALAGLVSFYGVDERAAVFTPAQVRELDRATIEDIGVPGPVLMERAALGVSALIQARFADRHTLIVCGPGNNGGDGLAAARQLHLSGHPTACAVTVASAEDLSPDAALNLRLAQKTGVNLRMGDVPDYLWEEAELVVDCLLGTGARGELRGRVAEWTRHINAARARGVPVLAVDVPSGVDATTGSKAQGAVAADCTITFHTAKSGLVCPPGSEAAGEVLVWDIGLPGSLEPEPDLWVVSADDVNVPGRRVDDHKYRAGYVAVLAGSRSYPGAAWLAAQAAVSAGAGYVRLLMTAEAADALRGRLTEVVLEEVGPGASLEKADGVLDVLGDERVGSVVVGPGLGRSEDTLEAVRRVVRESTQPMVLDADGLYAFRGDAEALRSRAGLVLTPHVGELATLLSASVGDLAGSALLAVRRAAEVTGQVVLLKGSSTVVVAPTGQTRVVRQGPPQLASAGTGDVLSGLIGALLAKGLEPFEAAYAGAWIHAEAGKRGAEYHPQGLPADVLIDLIAQTICDHLYERGPSWTT